MKLVRRSMKSWLISTTMISSAAVVLGLSAAPAQALQPSAAIPPTMEMTDANGVEFFTGKLSISVPRVKIGNTVSGLDPSGTSLSFAYSDAFFGVLNTATTGSVITKTVSLANSSQKFQLVSGSYVPISGSTGTLTSSGTLWTYTGPDGTKAVFDSSLPSDVNMVANVGVMTSITTPDGEIISMTYSRTFDDFGWRTVPITASSSLGWMVKYDGTAASLALNSSVDYCDPNATTCSGLTQTWPSSTSTYVASGAVGTYTITDGLSHSTVFSNFNRLANKIGSITLPTGANETIAYGTTGSGLNMVSSITRGTSVWTYSYSVSGNLKTVTVTSPNTGVRTVVVDTSLTQVVSDTDELGRKTSYSYDGNGRIFRVVNPDATYSGATLTGGYTEYAYDGRGNVVTTTVVPRAGSGLSNLVTTAGYPATCSNVNTCNKPDYVIDDAGIRTDYTYDSSSGGVATVTKQAVGGVAPQTRYAYSQFTPYVKNSAGTLVPSSQVWRLTQVKSCMSLSAATCQGTADELKTVISYGTNNIQPVSVTTELGNNTLASTVNYAYDVFGNVVSADGPLPGANDTIYYFYDALNRKVGEIYADPDGVGGTGGPGNTDLLRQAARVTYNADGKVSMVERGTVTDTTLSALNAMTVLDKSTADYDAATGLQIFDKYYANASGTPQTVTQTTYDSSLRVSCVAQRLNPSIFTSLPASACTLGAQGSDGADKITQYGYDLASAKVKVTNALGTAQQADDVINTYNASDGSLATQADGKGNLTSYFYDGLGRLQKTCYPMPTSGTVSSTTDCRQTTFSGAVPTADTLRDGSIISLSYDANGRVSSRTGAGISETISYNNFDSMTSHSKNGQTETYTYNALGQLLSDAQPMGTITYDYDIYGRRTAIHYPAYAGASFVASYNYRDDGGLSTQQVAYNGGGAVTQARYVSDSYGRINAIARGPSSQAATSVGYDSWSRLLNLTNDIAGVSNDNTFSMVYAVDSKIKSRTNSNSAFDYPYPGSAQTINYGLNGLNQVSGVNSTTFGYDSRGNLTSDGAVTYGYNAENLLISTSAGATLTYDAEDRLLSVTKASVTTKFLYDGSDLIAEYDGSGALLRRYVDGPGTDQPIVWYEGTAVAAPRYFTADPQGSIVGVADGSGNSLAVNTYDGYGIPASTNIGRFQYTGQTYLAEIGLYYYKARMYSPTLGRFMQADPIGYGDGMNWYIYGYADPIDNTDPYGLDVVVHGQKKCPTGWTCVSPEGRALDGQVGGPANIVGPQTKPGEVVVHGKRPKLTLKVRLGKTLYIIDYVDDGKCSFARTMADSVGGMTDLLATSATSSAIAGKKMPNSRVGKVGKLASAPLAIATVINDAMSGFWSYVDDGDLKEAAGVAAANFSDTILDGVAPEESLGARQLVAKQAGSKASGDIVRKALGVKEPECKVYK